MAPAADLHCGLHAWHRAALLAAHAYPSLLTDGKSAMPPAAMPRVHLHNQYLDMAEGKRGSIDDAPPPALLEVRLVLSLGSLVAMSKRTWP